MKKGTLILLAAGFLLGPPLAAQERYLDPVFSGVTVTPDIQYAQNISIITGAPASQDLKFDLYVPTGDTLRRRPLILLAPTGNFLPPIVNGSPTGSIRDSANVELAKRLAKLGYVVASYFYRQGWDPLNSSQDVRTATILQAAYRGIQDTRALIRFFRKSVAESGNPYGIDPDRIVVGGIGTGGYVSLGSAYISDFVSEIQIPKFQNFTTGQYYVDTALHGNIFGTNTTPLNVPNNLGYSSDFNMVFNLGGALGDSGWIQAGEMPYVGFHTPQDPFAPYDVGTVIVPTTGDIVIDNASGSFAVGRIANRLNLNKIFKDANFNDVFTQAANALNNGYEGLFPFNRPFTPGQYPCQGLPLSRPLVPEGSPWSWWNEAAFIATWDAAVGNPPGAVVNCDQRAGNPDMSASKGRIYLDSVVGYLAPRMYVQLSLYPTRIEDFQLDRSLSVFPNPAREALFVRLSEAQAPLAEVSLMDQAGRIVARSASVRAYEARLETAGLPAGLYLLRVQDSQGGIASRKVVIE